MLIDLKGKVGIVTGAGAGIGRELALTLAREGVTTVALDVSRQGLDAFARQLAAEGLKGTCFECDVRDGARIKEIVQLVAERYGRIDILLNNAGVAPGGTVETLSEEAWDLNVDINLKGTFLMSRAVVPIMKKQKYGRIINAASFAAIIPSFGNAAYSASKAGVVFFTRVLAGEVGPWGITVNCYAPGMIPTGINNFDKLPQDKQEKLLNTLTLRRWETPADVAGLICFLASDLAAYITGTLIDCSGGKLATQRPEVAYEAAADAGGSGSTGYRA
jgi:3-oxoacyl-[acyl-carrier protein] reductase